MAQVALITGASAGLGLEFAKLFAADRHDLVLVARRRDRLDALALELSGASGVRVHVIAADLMDPAAPGQIVDDVRRLGLEIEFLVNNAGFGSHGAFWKLDAARERGMVEVNITALVVLTRAFLPDMVRRGHGRILNLGSAAGFQPGPFMSGYYATKAFVNTFTEGLAYELKGTGVTATVSCPGATATEFAAVAGNQNSRLFRMGATTAAVVAAEAYRAMHAGTPMIVHGLRTKLAVWSAAVSPRSLVTAIAAALNKTTDAG
jgi:short-subunit dehydrogenase